MLLAALVLSHWLLDLITHAPDLPLGFTEETKLGFGLWNNIAATLIVEGCLFATGVFIYSRVTRPKNRTGAISFWGLVIFLMVVYVMNINERASSGCKCYWLCRFVAMVACCMGILG